MNNKVTNKTLMPIRENIEVSYFVILFIDIFEINTSERRKKSGYERINRNKLFDFSSNTVIVYDFVLYYTGNKNNTIVILLINIMIII